MCGIIGYTGHHNVQEILLGGLATLEYRGYDSAGLALLMPDGSVQVTKTAGRVQALEAMCQKDRHDEARCGIGHTRWATHGGVTDANAHPHSFGRVTLVHNGIIENYQELTAKYGFGEKLSSQTDTEVVAALLEHYYTGNPQEVVFKTVRELKGTFALAILFSDIPDKIFAIRNVSPIVAGTGIDATESFLASDATVISGYVEQYFVLPEYTLAELSGGQITLTGEDGAEVRPLLLHADRQDVTTKEGYSSYMEKEIAQQPRVIAETIQRRLRDGLPDFSADGIPDDIWMKHDRITIIGCGTAMHAGLAVKGLLQGVLGIPVTVEIASEYRYAHPVVNEQTLVIAISQSGETIDTLTALRYARAAKAGNISIVNVKGSTIARESQYVIYTDAGAEIAVASTKAYTTQLAALYLVFARLAYARGVYTKRQTMDFIRDMLRVPDCIGQVLGAQTQLMEAAEQLAEAQDVFMIGRGQDYTTLLEGSLKLKEVSYIHSESYASGELKHGTIALITQATPVIALVTQTEVVSKELSNAIEVRARGGRVLLLVREDISLENEAQWEYILRLPALRDELMVFPAVVVLQLLALFTAGKRGLDVDKPRNLAKVVTVE